MFRLFGRSVAALVLGLTIIAAVPTLAAAEGSGAVEAPKAASRIVEVRTQVRVENLSGDAAENLVVVVPPTVLSRVGSQRVLSVSYVTEPESLRETPAGFEATYRLAAVAPGASFLFEQVYLVELAAGLEPVVEEEIDPQYLKAEAGIESDNAAIRARALAVTFGKQTATDKVEAIVDFVSGYLTYDLKSTARNQGALAGFEARTGVCSEYAGLTVAMARAAGVPARLVYGWANGSGLVGTLGNGTRHVWVEFYDADRGWITVDPTFASVRPQGRRMEFTGINHVAQDWTRTSFSAGYGGRAIVVVRSSSSVKDVPSPVAGASGSGL